MRVRLGIGSRAGEVHDLPPREARAMLADGRATLPDHAPAPVSVAAPEAVADRTDRSIHAVHRRGRRR